VDMKKVVVIGIALLYLSLNVVKVIHLHFCHHNLKAVAFTAQPDCPIEKHHCHSGCCDDLIIVVDFDTDHVYTTEEELHTEQLLEACATLLLWDSTTEGDTRSRITQFRQNTAPPDPLYKRTHSYIFYG